MRADSVRTFLNENQIHYEILKHTRAFTAQEIAAAAHIPGQELAKTVILKVNGDTAMAVLPASFRVNTEPIKKAAGSNEVRVATEDEFEALFPDCELGAMPPFGNLYGMEVFADESLAGEDDIIFNAGCHTELIRMAYQEYEKLVRPKVLHFAYTD